MYYYKHPDEDLASSEVIAPMVEGLVKIKGASRNSRVENISFIGLTFAHSDWNLVAIGDSRGQATLQGPTAVIAMGNQNWHFDIYRPLMSLVRLLMWKTAEGLSLSATPSSILATSGWP